VVHVAVLVAANLVMLGHGRRQSTWAPRNRWAQFLFQLFFRESIGRLLPFLIQGSWWFLELYYTKERCCRHQITLEERRIIELLFAKNKLFIFNHLGKFLTADNTLL